MKTLNSLKLAGLLVAAVSLSVGCAGTTEETQEEPVVEPVTVEPTITETSMSDYTVVRGDSLWAIAAMPSVYGNPYQWPLIYKANSDKIKDADLIYPGQVLGIDNNPSSADIDAAVRHARTRGSWSIGVVEESDQAYLAQ